MLPLNAFYTHKTSSAFIPGLWQYISPNLVGRRIEQSLCYQAGRDRRRYPSYVMHRWGRETSPGAGQRSRCPTGPSPAPHAARAAVTVPGGISCLRSLAAGTAAYIWRIELPHTSECKSPSKTMQCANASLQTPATGKLSRALQGTNSLRKETWLSSLLGDNLPCSPGEQSRGSAWHPAALPSCLPPLLPGSAAADRDQATCPQHPPQHLQGSAPANLSACSFAAKSRSNLCYALRERATFLSSTRLQLTLRTFKSF